MQKDISRRGFLAGAAAVGTGILFSPLETLACPAAADIRLGYAAITWGGNDLQAIQDIAAVGFRGIQLRSNILKQFGERPAALRDLLEQHGLTMVAFSSGNLRLDPALERDDLELHTRHARFVRDVGGLYLQIIDERPSGRSVEPGDYTRMGQLLAELGKRTTDFGIPLAYHHHMNSLGERPAEVRAVLDSADPRYVKLLLDVAHYQQGGGDPVRAIEEYRERLLLLHIKDLESPVPGATGDLSRSYRFVELGRGTVDLDGVFAALDRVGFRGWAIVELDRVPDASRTPRDSAVMSRDYLEKRIGVRVGPRPGASPAGAGWAALFDGATLAGWRGYRRPDASATRWRVDSGLLTIGPSDGSDTGGARDLITGDTFDEFELAFEWRIAPGGNSGVKYFVLEDRDAAIGHEYQIIDDERHPDALAGLERQTASLYDVLAASGRQVRPAGEFNEGRILVEGRRVEHWLNGTRVLQYELDSAALKAAIADSKFKDVARFGTRQRGHILLQDHGDQVWYRNVRIRRR